MMLSFLYPKMMTATLIVVILCYLIPSNAEHAFGDSPALFIRSAATNNDVPFSPQRQNEGNDDSHNNDGNQKNQPQVYIIETKETTYSLPSLESISPSSSPTIINFSSSAPTSTNIPMRNSSGIARCYFRTGNANRDKSLSPFFIPTRDINMYEEGVRDYLSSLGVSPDTLRIDCEDITTEEYNTNITLYKSKKFCKLCIYNEISEDRKHINQGQVLDSYLHECIFGTFDNRKKMNSSQYHPICYPPPPITPPSSPKTSNAPQSGSTKTPLSSRNEQNYSKNEAPFFHTTCRNVTPRPHEPTEK